MKVLSVAQMREADRRAIEEIGIPSAVLMNNAGAAVFEHLAQGPVSIVCGKGNNGGDGYVVARLALLAGMEVRVLHIGNPDDLRGDSRTFRDAYQRLGGRVTDVEGTEALSAAVTSLANAGVLVDALLGTGISGEVRGDARAVIDAWPEVRTIAVDLPSGLDGDSGAVCGNCVRAETTVTFQFPTPGLLHEQAATYVGRLIVADIGIPDVCADDTAWHALRHDS